ncbi:MAG: FKBP-type peptidyl-prolyl cis-trans isomerase [Bacteroidales bacterium]|nr:FKBP-type peptidyl-prolyl cis-trans isomerase [Bacteroidales bacterium]
MKSFLIPLILVLFFVSCDDNPNKTNNDNKLNNQVIKTVKLKSKQDTIDYCIGVVIGKQMQEYGIYNFNEEILMQAINDVLSENDQNLPIHPDVAKHIVSIYIRQNLTEKYTYDASSNGKFMKENAQDKNVTVLSNGIQYKEIIKGSGKIPTKNDNVTVHYTGKLINGNIIVSTEGKAPVSFDISSSLKGWQEVLTRMPVDSEWIIFLPPEFAFGQNGGKNVPPNSVVIYQIKLLSIN